ncbi:MAG: trypsin-like peptidase domain-containing protein [Planctomycetia bacterium]|nr:trypsin-like peptidase domain-containing protein [Planctomycetia bacterium]
MKNNFYAYLGTGLLGSLCTLGVVCLLLPITGKDVSAQLGDTGLKPLVGAPALPGNTPSTTVPLKPRINEKASIQTTTQLLQERYDELLPEERVSIQIYEKHNRSVVNIETVFVREAHFMFQEEAEGRGSGIVFSDQGIILTNYHVIEKANGVSVTLYNGESYQAKLIGADPNTDIALLKIDAPKELLVPVELGDSSRLLVGQLVYAIGNPFGHDRTMTRGIISNLNRTIASPNQFRQIKGVIQVDAAINPGNSGGPLFDSRGRLIGMNTAIASRVGENSGVGFSIPSNTIARIGRILLEQGKVVRGDIGIIQVTETENGLVPVLIDNGGAADKAGLQGQKVVIATIEQNGMEYQMEKLVKPKRGFDLIIGVNGQKVKTADEFITAIEEHRPGDTVNLDIIRNRRQISLPVVLDAPVPVPQRK